MSRMELAHGAPSPIGGSWPLAAPDRVTVAATPLHVLGRSEARCIDLPRGLPGFPGVRELALKALPGGRADLMLLASPKGQPCFVVLPLMAPDLVYGRGTIAAAAGLLGMEPQDVSVFAIVTLQRGAEGLSGAPNLRAPLLIDMARGRGEQMTLAPAVPHEKGDPAGPEA